MKHGFRFPLTGARVVGVLLILLSFLPDPLTASADYDRGRDAYEQGDYTDAYQIWLPLAIGGDARAQTAIATLHDTGKGVKQDPVAAARWYRLAAEQGKAEAQFILGMMYYSGDGVVQDYHQAWKWYDLAARNGMAIARHSRNLVRDIMSGTQP